MKRCSAVVILAGAVTLGAQTDRPAVLYRDITREAGITFQHHAAPEKKYHRRIDERRRGAVRLRQRRPARHLFRRLAHGRNRERPAGGAQRALSEPRRREIRGRHGSGGRRVTPAGRWASAPRTSTATAGRTSTSPASAETVCTATSRMAPSPTSPRAPACAAAAGRRDAASPTTIATAVSTCSSAAT